VDPLPDRASSRVSGGHFAELPRDDNPQTGCPRQPLAVGSYWEPDPEKSAARGGPIMMRMARRDALQLGAGIFAGACLSPHMSLRAQTPLPAGTHPRLHEIEPGADLRLSGSPLSGRGEEAWIQNTHTFMRASGVRVQLSPSGGPPDIVFSLHHRLKQFSSDMAHPLDELATALGHSYGGWFPIARYYATDDYGRWISLPLGGYGTAIVYRPSLIRAAGFDTIPDDFEGFLHLCQRLFSIGAPAAFGFGSDLNGTWTDWLLSGFGSSLFDENGLRKRQNPPGP
jgi:multiple sugar transport system substrate-binding protein